MSSDIFKFKQFQIAQEQCSMKIGTDGVLLGAWVSTEGANSVLDIGTGSGVIALMVAQRTKAAKISAVEIDEKSFNQAKQNIDNSPWSSRMDLYNNTIQDYAKTINQTFDLIVCNPPFFTGGTFSNNQERNDVRHTIKLPNGDLLMCANNLLNKNGKFCVILPYIEGLRFKEMAETYGLYTNRVTSVIGKVGKPVERLLIEFCKEKCDTVKEDELVIQIGGRDEYSEEYVSLTKDFYLKM